MPPLHVDSVKKPTENCKACGKTLEALAKHDSRLAKSEGDEPQIERQDYCPECQEKARAGEYHSRWFAKRPLPPPPTKSATRKAQAVRFREEFYRLIDATEREEQDEDKIYLLAHLLMRTGAFKWLENDEERGVLVFEDVAKKQRHDVVNVPLDGDRLAEAQEGLSDLL